jgi:hypothetical protein
MSLDGVAAAHRARPDWPVPKRGSAMFEEFEIGGTATRFITIDRVARWLIESSAASK